jgi:hypothetical protein
VPESELATVLAKVKVVSTVEENLLGERCAQTADFHQQTHALGVHAQSSVDGGLSEEISEFVEQWAFADECIVLSQGCECEISG